MSNIDSMQNIKKNEITNNIALKPFANLCDFQKGQQIHNTLQMNAMDAQTKRTLYFMAIVQLHKHGICLIV